MQHRLGRKAGPGRAASCPGRRRGYSARRRKTMGVDGRGSAASAKGGPCEEWPAGSASKANAVSTAGRPTGWASAGLSNEGFALAEGSAVLLQNLAQTAFQAALPASAGAAEPSCAEASAQWSPW